MPSKFQLRPAQQMFDKQSFGAPKDLGDITERLSSNIDFYQANYAIVVALALLYASYYDSYVMWAVALLAGGGYWLFFVRKQTLVLSGRPFSDKELILLFAAFSLVLLQYAGGKLITYSLAFAAILILAHAIAKKQSLQSKATNAINDIIGKVQ